MGVVFHRPINRIARQSVLAGKGGDTTVFQPAEPALGGGPERTVRIESKVVDLAFSQPAGGRVRCADPILLEMRDAPLRKPKP